MSHVAIAFGIFGIFGDGRRERWMIEKEEREEGIWWKFLYCGGNKQAKAREKWWLAFRDVITRRVFVHELWSNKVLNEVVSCVTGSQEWLDVSRRSLMSLLLAKTKLGDIHLKRYPHFEGPKKGARSCTRERETEDPWAPTVINTRTDRPQFAEKRLRVSFNQIINRKYWGKTLREDNLNIFTIVKANTVKGVSSRVGNRGL